jgi:hypothetical protein
MNLNPDLSYIPSRSQTHRCRQELHCLEGVNKVCKLVDSTTCGVYQTMEFLQFSVVCSIMAAGINWVADSIQMKHTFMSSF